MKVGAIDLAIVIVYVAAITLFGLWTGRGAKTLADYSAAGRNLPWWVVMVSIVATETSTVTFLSIPGFAYGRDLTWLQIAIGFCAGRILVSLWMLPQYFRGNFLTSYEVLAGRFGGSTQQAASLLFVVTRTLADGIRLFLTSLVFAEMTGMPIPMAVAGVGLVMIVYTYVGGVKAVIWTEFAQFGVYVGGALLAFKLLLERIPGGLGGVLAAAGDAGKLRVFDFSLDPSEPYAFWAGLLGGIFVTFGSHGVDQLMVQRVAGAPGGTGVVLISGTGSIAWGMDATGKSARSGGWGYLLGDEGSAFWLGHAAVRQGIRAADGRGPATTLYDRIRQRLGVEGTPDLVDWFYDQELSRTRVAELAGVVEEAANDGDLSAEELLDQAAGHLVRAARSVVSQLAFPDEFPLVLSGGAFRACPSLVPRIEARLHLPAARVARLEAGPASGAVRLALQLLAPPEGGRLAAGRAAEEQAGERSRWGGE